MKRLADQGSLKKKPRDWRLLNPPPVGSTRGWKELEGLKSVGNRCRNQYSQLLGPEKGCILSEIGELPAPAQFPPGCTLNSELGDSRESPAFRYNWERTR